MHFFFSPSYHLRARCDLIVHNCVSIGFSFMQFIQFLAFKVSWKTVTLYSIARHNFFVTRKTKTFPTRGTNDEKNFRFAGRVFAMKPFSLVHVNTQHFFLRLFGTNRNIKSGSLSLFSWLTVDLKWGFFSICHFLNKMDGEWKRKMSHQSLVLGISLLLLYCRHFSLFSILKTENEFLKIKFGLSMNLK